MILNLTSKPLDVFLLAHHQQSQAMFYNKKKRVYTLLRPPEGASVAKCLTLIRYADANKGNDI